MKNTSTARELALTAALAALLAGCATPAAAKSGAVLDDIYTSVALTVAADNAQPGSTPTPTATGTPVPTTTPYPTATLDSTLSTRGYAYAYAGGCNNAAYVSDVTIADGTQVAPGGTFTKTWQMLNTGSCTWSTQYSVFFVSGDSMDGATTTIQQTVSPGQAADISVDLTAPDDVGSYTGYWRLEDNNGTAFGEQVYVQISVTDDTVTGTATPTITSTASPVATPLPTGSVVPTPTREDYRHRPTRTPRAASPTPTPGS